MVEDEDVKETYREFAHTSFVPSKEYFSDERLFVRSRKRLLDLEKSRVYVGHETEDVLFIATNYHFEAFQFLKGELGVDVALRWDPMMKKMEAVIFYGKEIHQFYHTAEGPLCAEIALLAKTFGIECNFMSIPVKKS